LSDSWVYRPLIGKVLLSLWRLWYQCGSCLVEIMWGLWNVWRHLVNWRHVKHLRGHIVLSHLEQLMLTEIANWILLLAFNRYSFRLIELRSDVTIAIESLSIWFYLLLVCISSSLLFRSDERLRTLPALQFIDLVAQVLNHCH
jgi:hypothetical protein